MVLSGGDPRGDGATGEGMRDAEADRARGARGAVGGEGARFDRCGFGRINHSAAFCAMHSRLHGFEVAARSLDRSGVPVRMARVAKLNIRR